MPNIGEIIGFPPLRAEPRFELSAELRLQRQAEIARITEIAVRLTMQFGAATAVGFSCFEILGRAPDRECLEAYAERLHRTPSVMAVIVEELLALAPSQQ
jgi:hypothetical protein